MTSYKPARRHPYHAKQLSRSHTQDGFPPSPPRSRRDGSETPSLSVASGSKWWHGELPPPPASLTSILDSFAKSGEGDRELLFAILAAKKAEEERLTALIQTRLAVYEARLSLHAERARTEHPPIPAKEMLPPPPRLARSTDSSSPRLILNPSPTLDEPPIRLSPPVGYLPSTAAQSVDDAGLTLLLNAGMGRSRASGNGLVRESAEREVI
ncbi:hypothetical protein P7C73_g1235, partial [Tremellales sp. Uapishka_1]